MKKQNNRQTKRVLLSFLLHPKRLRMILSSACALAGRRTSSSRDAPRSSLWRSASKAGQRSHKWSYDSSSLSHRRHMVSSDRLIRLFQRRSVGWWPLRKRRGSVVSDLDSRTTSCQSGIWAYGAAWSWSLKCRRVSSGLSGWQGIVRRKAYVLPSQVWLLHCCCCWMIQRSACARDAKRESSSMDASRSSLLRSVSKAGHRSHMWSYVSSSSLQVRHVASSD